MFGSDQHSFYAKARAFIAGNYHADNDEKLKVLVDSYADQHLVYSAPAEIEDMRRHAHKMGILTSIGMFGLNEFTRLSLRARKSFFLMSISDLQALHLERGLVGTGSDLRFPPAGQQPDQRARR